MRTNIRGNKVEVTEAIKKYIEEKIGKLDKYFEKPEEIEAKIVIKVRGKEQIVEVTIPIKKIIIRCEENHKDLYAAIDIVTDKLERQIRKNKTRMKRRGNVEELGMNLSFDEEEEERVVVKRKEIEMKPMSEEEAILQMNLIGHEFFVFKNTDTDNIDILYRRKDGDYGIISTL
ncbi:MAG: ribosome-associated translation inhibitor RaiA [Clostridia bacterium]|nr:ribosome-associated translation inhibitor RaiA [Clostridia bacterium]